MTTAPTERLTAALADRYRILRHLGAGGMATVYLAEDLKHDRKVAIKVLKPDLAAVLGAERFVVEIKTTAALQHPHILPLFDSGSADGFLFYVMPYIEGETLRDKLNREAQVGVEEAVRITCEVADALDYAHRHGVIHRDIKPENILLHDGRPMVADFGIALAVSAAAGGRMTETGLSLGTPHYMSPEQATAEKELSARSDIYSLASVCYEMLAGQPPHVGGTAQQIIMKIIAEDAAPVTTLRKSVPPHVALTLAKALQKVPADRFASAKEFREALSSPLSAATLGTGVFAAGLPGTAAASRDRRPLAIAAAVVVLASVAAVAGWMRPLPEMPVKRFLQDFADSLPLADVNANRLAISPDGQMLAMVVGRGDATRLYVRALDELNPRPLAGTEGAVNPSFSPDGKHLAFVTTRMPRALRVVPVEGGLVTTLTDSLVDLGGVSWGDDGYIYYDGHLEGDGVARIREAGGTPEIATTPPVLMYQMAPQPLPGGQGLLFTQAGSLSSETVVGLLDRRTGEQRVLTTGFRALYSTSGHLLVVTRDGQLMAAPFDLNELEVTGEFVVAAEGIHTFGARRTDIGITGGGDLVYLAGASTTALSRELVWVARDGKRSLVDPSWQAQITGRLQFSPDGRTLAVTLGSGDTRSVWVKDVAGGPASRVAEVGWSAIWSSDGRTLYYQRPDEIAMSPADGSAQGVRVRGAGAAPVLTPDGESLVWQAGGDIYTARLRGDTATKALVADRAAQALPRLSPDGRWVLYQSDETGVTHIYVRPFPDAAASRRQISIAGGTFATWSRSGREIFFLNGDSLYVSDIETSRGFVAKPPRALFSTTGLLGGASPFDVSPDGSRFVFVAAAGMEQLAEMRIQMAYVQNFAAELRARLPPNR